MFYELTRWYAYRQIKHSHMWMYTILMPNIIALTATFIFFVSPVELSVLGETGLIAAILGSISLLPGFFIAALAAVTTFQRDEMDVDMPDPAPTINIRSGTGSRETSLTRRMFLAYLFSYLAIASLLLVVFCYSINLLAPSLMHYLPQISIVVKFPQIGPWLEILLVYLLLFWSGSILVTTLHGIFFLSERMHQPN